MSEVFFTSDCHFFHKNIINYSNRPFTDIRHMTESLIARWNKKVSEKDIVWNLGDFSFGSREETEKVLKRLNGHHNFIWGNHDQIFEKNTDLLRYFESVQHYKELKIDGQKMVLFHFPLLTWNKGHRGALHFHGHCHGSVNHLNQGTTRIDVGVDNFDYAPVSFEELRKQLKDVKYVPVDHHV